MKILLLAGEESGLLYARQIAERIRARVPEVEFRGYADYGFHTHDMAVMGIGPVLMKFGYFLKLRNRMMRAIDEWKPDLCLTVDYPGMNLKLAAYAKSRGVRTVHVVCPQVWAWHEGRIPKIEASLDALCCFLPFEPALFKPGFATFVGHPLMREFADVPECRPQAADGHRLVALLPGSRKGEIEKILPLMIEVARRLRGEFGERLAFVIPAATPRALAQIRALLGRERAEALFAVQLGGARELLKKADCAAVASGTATLEAALARCPTVLVYKMTAFFAWVIRHIVRGTNYAGLVNVVWARAKPETRHPDRRGDIRRQTAEGEIQPMPELVQEEFTVESALAALRPLIDDGPERRAALARLEDALRLLRAPGDPIGNIVDAALGV